MRRVVYGSVFVLFAFTSANAQQVPKPPPFTPFTVTEADRQDIMLFLHDNVPGRYADPLMNWLNGLEQRAVKMAADKAAADKKEATKKPEGPSEEAPSKDK